MRIAVGGFCHETNMFCSVRVDMEQLGRCTKEGAELIRAYTGAHGYVGGFLDEAAELGVEAVPTRMTSLKPSGPCVSEGVELSLKRIVELLCQAHREQKLDGIALFMHGASATEGHPDIEGELLQAIRENLGYEIPVGMVLDLHGNITEEMVEKSDLLMGCKEYPHVDEYDQGRNMFRILCDMVKKNYRPAKKLIKLPWHMVPAQGCTLFGPAHDVRELCLQKEREDPDMIQASLFQGFPYSDVPSSSVSVVVMAKTQEAADRNAAEIAKYAWDRRADYQIPLYSARQAVDLALQAQEGPVLIHESSDNPGGGTPGDGTHLLRELLQRDVPSAFGMIYDPEVAEQAARAGAGAYIRCSLGGKTDNIHGKPIELQNAYVKAVSDGIFTRVSPVGFGSTNDLGITVCLVVGNVRIVVYGGRKNGVGVSRTQTFDDGPFRVVGVDWEHMPVLALKSAQHFKGWWADKVKAIIPCESPGLMSADLTTFSFRQANTGYYPLKDARYE